MSRIEEQVAALPVLAVVAGIGQAARMTPEAPVTRWTLMPSPVDDLLATSDGESLTGLWFTPHDRLRATLDLSGRDDGLALFARLRTQLDAYFARDLREFALPLAARGSQFQQRVWAVLREIPFGQTRSYGQIAERLGLGPEAARAVGTANGANPIPVVVPCHRVIGADGALTGFAGGLPRKRFLLDLEADLLF